MTTVTTAVGFLTPRCTQIQGLWSFDSEDPLVIRLTLTQSDGNELSWEFSRSLLVDAFISPHVGNGDVRIWVNNDTGRLVVSLASSAGSTILACPYGPTWKWLLRTEELCPEGLEDREVSSALDRWLFGQGFSTDTAAGA